MKKRNIYNSNHNGGSRSRRSRTLAPIIGMAGLAAALLPAHAQSVFQYTSGDLILDLSKSGANDLEADLGNISTFISQAPGTTVALGGDASGGAFTSAQLATVFGSGSTALDGVTLTAFATSGSHSDFLTDARSNPSVQNGTPGGYTLSQLSSISTDAKGIIGVGASSGIQIWSAQNNPPSAGVINTATTVGIPSGDASSFTTKSPSLTGVTGSGIENSTAAGFTAGASPIVSDLFEYGNSGSSPTVTYLGDFTFNPDGEVDFTSATAAPEPSAFGLLASSGLVFLSLKKKIGAYFRA
jgi:hypothetical protein